MSNRATGIGFLAPVGHSARDLEKGYFIGEALQLPGTVITYHVSERLAALFPHQAIVETDAEAFEVEEYARAGLCTLTPRSVPHAEWITSWHGPEDGLKERVQNAWLEVTWQGHELEILVLHWGYECAYFILAATKDVARSFLGTVCAWSTEVRAEVLVFDQGHWAKDRHLFNAIKGARFDNLVLPAGLADEILGDVRRFFAARAIYEGFGVPWKRGLLLAGPPGNGKTHTAKALVNALGQPCLYVKSFRAQESPDEYGMRAVFERARASAPCILVLEDLDALVTEANRSFFLNEMDGFAVNGGILTLATTNHPERLDPAIVQRPSRFDRTYRFDLPAQTERHTYIARWNDSLQPAMQVSPRAVSCIAARTEGFSFAYLKELFLSAAMRWLETPVQGTMDAIIGAQVDVLREQMLSAAAVDRDAGVGGE